MKKLLLRATCCLLAAFTAQTAQAQWALQPVTFTNTYLAPRLLDAVTENVVWAAGFDATFYSGGDEVIRTVDGGTWTRTKITNLLAGEEIYGIAGLSATTAVVCTNVPAGGGRLLKTSDGGTTWTVQSTATQFATADSSPRHLLFFTQTDGVCLGNPATGTKTFEVYRTADAGTTWVAVPAANIAALATDERTLSFRVAASGNSCWVGTTSGNVFASADKGLTWKASASTLTAAPLLGFRDATHGLALDPNTKDMASTTDGGLTWSILVPTGPVHATAIRHLPGTNAYLSAGSNSNDSGTSRSTDDGASWTVVESRLHHGALDAVSASSVWSSAESLPYLEGLGIYKNTAPLLATRVASQRLGLSVYPNPSSSGVFAVALTQGRAGDAQVTVTDALGRSVYAGTLPAAGFTLDLGQQAPGLYLLQLRTTAGVAQQSLLVR